MRLLHALVRDKPVAFRDAKRRFDWQDRKDGRKNRISVESFITIIDRFELGLNGQHKFDLIEEMRKSSPAGMVLYFYLLIITLSTFACSLLI